MLCLVAALAVPRTPDTHAALAEPEASDTHELERGLFDRTACKDRIKDDMSIWDAMAACAQAKKCAFCAVQVEKFTSYDNRIKYPHHHSEWWKYETRTSAAYPQIGAPSFVAVANKERLDLPGLTFKRHKDDTSSSSLSSSHDGATMELGRNRQPYRWDKPKWLFRCTSHPYKWHGAPWNKKPPRCPKTKWIDTIAQKDFGNRMLGPRWLVPMEKKKLTADYMKLYHQVVKDEPCLCVQEKFETMDKYLPKTSFFGKKKTRARASRLYDAAHACSKELDPAQKVSGYARTFKYSEEELKKCLKKDDKDDESDDVDTPSSTRPRRRRALDDDEDDDNLKWAREKIEQFEQDQGV